MVTFICPNPNCDTKEIIVLFIGDPNNHHCPNCGEIMEIEDSQE